MTLEAELRRLVERLQPDLRPYMRFALTGTVVAVHEDDYAVDVEITDDVSLPNVPVGALWARSHEAGGASWGVWALPEVGADVTIAFRDGDVTQPYVENCVWPSGKAPAGYRVGMFVIRDRHGQSFEFKPDEGVVELKADNIRLIAGGNLGEVILRDRRTEIGGTQTTVVGKNRTAEVGGSARESIAGDLEQIVAGVVRQHVGKLVQELAGNLDQQISGSLARRLSGSAQSTILGAELEAVAKHWQKLIGGNVDLKVTNADGSPTAFALSALTGNVSFEALAGLIQLGGATAIAPAVLGTQLVQALTDLVNLFANAIAIVQSPTPAGPVPTPIDPALRTQLQAWVSALPTAPFLSQKVLVA